MTPSRKLAVGLCVALVASVGARAQTPGCTDARAQNYDARATANDGSCTYRDTLLGALRQNPLDPALDESSGLAFAGGALYSHNDSDDANLYRVDTLSGAVVGRWSLGSKAPYDWEAIAVLDGQLYVGDFGNNASGNRRDLHILKLGLDGLLAGGAGRADTLHFAYADQTDFSARANNVTDYDCEAFFVTADSVYLLTKEWTRQQTTLYTFPNLPGRHIARARGRLNVAGLVTDVAYRPEDGTLVMSGYNSTLQPFAYLLYGFAARDFFGGNKRRVMLDLPFHQVEGIASRDARRYYVSNERFSRSIITTPQKLIVFDLGGLLSPNPLVATRQVAPAVLLDGPAFYPNPAQDKLTVHPALLPAVVMLRDSAGRIVIARRLTADTTGLDIGVLPAGAYSVSVGATPYGTLVKVE